MELGQLNRDLNSGTNQDAECGNLDGYPWFLGVNTCNTRRLANSPVESADGTSYFVTQIKQTPENLNI